MTPDAPISLISVEALERDLDAYASLLRACVEAGAAVNFVAPFSQADSLAFWREKTLPGARAGTRLVFAYHKGEALAGSVQLDLDTPPNQPHRGEVTKLLVDPGFRRQGIARALMTALIETARARGRTLLTLDTRSGDAAEPLYRTLGFNVVGRVPGYSWNVEKTVRDATTFMYLSVT